MRNYRDYLEYVKSIDRDDLAEYASCAKKRAGALIDYSAERARGFSILDFAVLKLCLVTFGVWLGSQFSKLFGKFRHVIFATFILSWVYLIWRIFLRDED